MDVQIIKVSLTEAESAQALPVLMQAIAGHAPVTFADIEPEQLTFNESGDSADASPVFDFSQSESSQTEASYSEDSVVNAASETHKISPPTGKASAVKRMVWNAKKRCFERRTVLDNFRAEFKEWIAQLDAIALRFPKSFTALIGVLIASVLLAVVWKTGLFLRAVAYLEDRRSEPAPVEIEPLPEASTAPVAPPYPPGDASSKAGQHGEKPSMEKGAIAK